MKQILFLSAVLSAALPLTADELPELKEQPWMGFWIAHDQRAFDYSIMAQNGRGLLYPKVRKSGDYVRAGDNDRFQFVFIVEEQVNGKWTRRMMKEDGFKTKQKASSEVEECGFVATYEGGSKARIHHHFKRGKIIFSTELIHKTTENPYRVGILILTPKIHNVLERKKVPSEDEIEDIMDDDEIRAVRVDGKRFKFKLHDKVKLGDPELLGDGASEFSLETKRYGGKPIIFSPAADDAGKFLFNQSKRLFHPYRVTWYPAENKNPSQEAELVIQFK